MLLLNFVFDQMQVKKKRFGGNLYQPSTLINSTTFFEVEPMVADLFLFLTSLPSNYFSHMTYMCYSHKGKVNSYLTVKP